MTRSPIFLSSLLFLRDFRRFESAKNLVMHCKYCENWSLFYGPILAKISFSSFLSSTKWLFQKLFRVLFYLIKKLKLFSRLKSGPGLIRTFNFLRFLKLALKIVSRGECFVMVIINVFSSPGVGPSHPPSSYLNFRLFFEMKLLKDLVQNQVQTCTQILSNSYLGLLRDI